MDVGDSGDQIFRFVGLVAEHKERVTDIAHWEKPAWEWTQGDEMSLLHLV